MTVTVAELQVIMPFSGQRAVAWCDPLNAGMDEFSINTNARMAAFLAQIAHESGELRYVEELASGAAYEGRADLGNTQPGDGILFKGRGFIQITGRANYQAIADAFGIDFVQQPVLLEQTPWPARSAAWWWQQHGLNERADAGDFQGITRTINGGLNGEADRELYWSRAKELFGA